MANNKSRVTFVCSNCGTNFSAWSGKCNVCGEWNTLQEEVLLSSSKVSGTSSLNMISPKTALKDKNTQRLITGVDEVDSVLGGGFVPGGVVLIAGQPGIGKSTLLLQLSSLLSKKHKVLYVSAEESTGQVGQRAMRIGADVDNLKIANSTNIEEISSAVVSTKFDALIVDSIQAVSTDGVNTLAGTVSQITNCTHILMNVAKQTNTAIIMVGHVTKEGSIAGPKVLEHVVDVVLQLEGDRYGGFKLLRSVKNRFGPTNEIGIFEMQENGLYPVKNPSASLLAERQVSDGSVVLATMEGTRAILVEVQALVNKTSYGYPKRTASGVDINRLNLLVAVLERRTKLTLSDKDIYVNLVGGIKITEHAADLAIAVAIGSAAKGMKLTDDTVVFGEIGLSGEIRHVPFVEKRIAEAKKLGFKQAIGPKTNTTKKIPMLSTVFNVRDVLNTYLT